jgi:hypothetical protein
MSKSGLADSPFFAPAQKRDEAPTPPPALEPEKSISPENVSSIPDFPTPDNPDALLPQAQNENNQEQKRTNVLSDVRTDERPIGRTNVRTEAKQKRRKIRHAFDIYQDQLFSLQMRQLEAVQRGKRKPKLGRMVQDAIDMYLKQGDNKRR